MIEKITGIYKIINSLNGKVYIGSSINILRRFSDHKSALHRNKHHSFLLQRSWNKYGEKNFKFEIIEECRKRSLFKREQFWMDYYNSFNPQKGYNRSPIAQCFVRFGPTKDRIETTCGYCKKSFCLVPFKVKRIKYCSIECRMKGRAEKFHIQSYIKLICHYCNKSFIVKKSQSHQLFCTQKCSGMFKRGKRLSKETIEKISISGTIAQRERSNLLLKKLVCPNCKKIFYRIPSRIIVCCSTKCSYQYREVSILFKCSYCKKSKQILPYLVKSMKRKFCSSKCYQKSRVV